MNFKWYSALVPVLFLLIPPGAFCQERVTDIRHVDVNFAELADYYKAHPLPNKIVMPLDEEENERDIPNHRPGPSSEVHLYRGTPGTTSLRGTGLAMLPASPNPNDTFLSTGSAGSNIPPDTHGAVDSQYCVTTTNSNVHIQNRVGGNISIVSLGGFWSSILPSGTSAFDPRVHYDANYKRWIMVTDAVNLSTMGSSTLMVGVSATNDPTGVWHLYSIAIDPTGASWLDFPNVGYNKKWIAVTGNMFGSAGGSVVYLFNYVSMMSGTAGTATKLTRSSSFSLCPAETFDAAEPSLFCLETWNAGMGQLRLWKITGAVGSETISSVGYPATSQHWHQGQPGGSDFGPQLGISNKIDLGDHRITSVVFRNKKLWCAHNVFLPSSGTATRCSIMWWQVDTLANPVQVGLVNDPTSAKFYAYPSIAVNKWDDALIGMGIFSLSLHPSAAYAWRMHTDPIDSMRPVFIFRHGQDTYYTTFGGSKNRWGDYSAASVDPRNDEDFWTIQETSRIGTSANWETWWANVQLCAKPGEPVVSGSSPIPCPGGVMSFTITPIAGATSYRWIVNGSGGWSGSSTSTTITLTAGTGLDTVVVLAYNACGQGESHTFTVRPLPLPGLPFISATTPPCTGVTTAVFTAASTDATGFTWSAVGGGWSGTGSGTTFSTTPGSGTGYIICTGYNSCGNGPTDTLTVTPGTPVASFSVAAHTTYTGIGDLVTFTGTAPAGSVYSWTFGGGTGVPGTGAGPHTVTWSTPGTKTISLTVNNGGCTATFSDTVHVNKNLAAPITSMPEHNLKVVPNPNDGSFALEFDEPVNRPVSIVLLDMQGRVVYRNVVAGGKHIPVVTNDLATGTYALEVAIEGRIITEKVTINR